MCLKVGKENIKVTVTHCMNNEKRVKQSRSLVVWLSACIGMVEGDSNPVEAYLNSGGDPTWKLSHSEAQLLARPRPGVYDADRQLCGLQTCEHTQRKIVEGFRIYP